METSFHYNKLLGMIHQYVDMINWNVLVWLHQFRQHLATWQRGNILCELLTLFPTCYELTRQKMSSPSPRISQTWI